MGVQGAIFPRKCLGTCASIGRVGSFVPKLHVRHTKINFLAAKKSHFPAQLELSRKWPRSGQGVRHGERPGNTQCCLSCGLGSFDPSFSEGFFLK